MDDEPVFLAVVPEEIRLDLLRLPDLKRMSFIELSQKDCLRKKWKSTIFVKPLFLTGPSAIKIRTANQDALPQAQPWFFWAQLPI